MRSIRRVKKAYKVYGKDKGYIFLTLFYSYWYRTKKIRNGDHEKELENFRTLFSKYILQKYGKDLVDAYWAFHLYNENNIKLIKKLDKKRSIFLNEAILKLGLEEQKEKASEGMNAIKMQSFSSAKQKLLSSVSREVEPLISPKLVKQPERKKPAISYTRKEVYHSNIGRYELDYIPDDTPGKIYSHLPARNIDYLPYSSAKRSFKFTLKRLYDGSEYIEYHSGKDMNEAMAIVNRISFDKARIIKVEEEVRK